ncbi:hypothetical protein KY331_00925 [Candidatus Woesearchaeota archaeon]|nr:hypothetical protein [Candidatus Woesearchaeota archaeon]
MKIAIYSTEDLEKISHDLLGAGGFATRTGKEVSYVPLWHMIDTRVQIPVEEGSKDHIRFSDLICDDRYDILSSGRKRFWFNVNASKDVFLERYQGRFDKSKKENLGTLVLHAKAEYETEDGKPKKARYLFQLKPTKAAFCAMLYGENRPELQTAMDYLTANLGIEPTVLER